MKRTSTYFPKPGEITEKWRVMDAQGQTLGRLARNIAIALQGKDKTNYVAHVLTGDFVVVTNAADLRVTGKKLDQKMYYRHSGYVGNLKTFRLREMMESRPDRVLELAVKGMLPKNHMGRQMMRRLKVYSGPDHPHEAQVTGHPAAQAVEDGG
ncbi:MAG: 50S ribosomal protein L13 [Chloroflexi bacterium]|nr:50S ribosomal protein L13 [Chloroflexota bacterium]MCI0902330.1 50S ribosomal protein L13 [Chloroflexota bacterium]